MATNNRYYKLLNNYIYVYQLDEFLVLPTTPESISDSMSSTFASTNALSRSSPVYSYSYSGPRSVQFSIKLHRDMMQMINWNVSNIRKDKIYDLGDDYVDYLIKRLQAISVPKYDANSIVQPPQVAVRFGNEIFVKGIVNGTIGVNYSGPLIQSSLTSDDMGKYAIVEITFNVNEVDPYDATTIAKEGSFRGITKTFKQGIFTS